MCEKLLELIFPRRCGFCNLLIKEDYACKKCKKKLEYIYNNEVDNIVEKNFEIIVSAYIYTGIIREKLLEFKFKNKKYLYRALTEKLLKDLQRYVNDIDYIVPVPISFKRYMERGYNQSYLIAKHISEKVNKPLCRFVLIKSKNNKKQSELGVKARITNVNNVYKVLNTKIIYGKNILLIDDIYTTGATVNECSKVLKQSGVKNIIVATIAKAKA